MNKLKNLFKYFPITFVMLAAFFLALTNNIARGTEGNTQLTFNIIQGLLALYIATPLILFAILLITGAGGFALKTFIIKPLRALHHLHAFITYPSRLRANRTQLALAGAPAVPNQIIERVNAEAAPKPPSKPQPQPSNEANKDQHEEAGPPIEAAAPPSPEDAARAWDELILPEATKRELLVLQESLVDPTGYRAKWGEKVDFPKGMILTGPPGTGKTTIAKALAGSAGYSFYAVSPADAKSMWHGQGEKQVKKIYETARANAPAIVFWDEMDAVASKRTEGPGSSQAHNSLVNQILQEIDGFATSDQVVFSAAATNRPDMLDDAIRSRLNYQIEIPLPIPEAREAMINLYMGHFLHRSHVPLEDLVERTEGMSGRDIKNLAQAVAFASTANGTDSPTETEWTQAFERVKTNDAEQKNYLN